MFVAQIQNVYHTFFTIEATSNVAWRLATYLYWLLNIASTQWLYRDPEGSPTGVQVVFNHLQQSSRVSSLTQYHSLLAHTLNGKTHRPHLRPVSQLPSSSSLSVEFQEWVGFAEKILQGERKSLFGFFFPLNPNKRSLNNRLTVLSATLVCGGTSNPSRHIAAAAAVRDVIGTCITHC